jgi:seipin
MLRLLASRYIMYNYRITSFVVLSTLFWFVEIVVATFIWISMHVIMANRSDSPKQASPAPAIKQEDDSAVETGGTGVDPLTPVSPVIKKEETPEVSLESYPAATEADIEDAADEGAATGRIDLATRLGPSDSGIGTSMESSSTRSDLVRRRSLRILKEEPSE